MNTFGCLLRLVFAAFLMLLVFQLSLGLPLHPIARAGAVLAAPILLFVLELGYLCFLDKVFPNNGQASPDSDTNDG